MTWFTETPFWVCSTGIFLGVVFLILFIHTQNARFLMMTCISALIVIVGFVGEQLIVTDKEEVENLVQELARNVRDNDADAILNRISSDNTEVRKRAEEILSECDFNQCSITRKPSFRMQTKNSAEIEFTVFVSVSESPYGPGGDNVTVELTLEKQGGQWMIQDYGYRLRNQSKFQR